MREPENLKELIEYFEWNYERMEDDHDVICTFTDGDGFHDLLNDLKRKSAMREANSNAVLAEVAPRKGFNAGRVVLHCGNCNSTNIRLNIDSCNQKHFKYCPDCGSKVDWRNFS